MTHDLPRPGSIWNQKPGIPYAPPKRMRVIFSSPEDVIAHNCEIADAERIFSWRGSAMDFFTIFSPGDPEQYPRTAG